MTHSDEDLDRIFRAANPVPPARARVLSAADIAVRESIIRGAYKPAQRQRYAPRSWAVFATAGATVAVAAIVTVNVLMPAQQAVALTPPPLHYSAAPPLAEVIENATDHLIEPPDVDQRSSVHSSVWAWNVEMADKHVEIVPQEITFEWAQGEAATATIVAGDSFLSDNERAEGVEPSPYEPGEVIDTVVTQPEDFTLPPEVVNLDGSAATDLQAALAAFGATPESSSGELLAAITGLLEYWTLDDEQHATLLELLVDSGGVTVRGETIDRLGRDVIGLQVSSVIPERIDTVFVSTETGRIVGMESELVTQLDGLPAGVITYTMWDADGR